MRVVVDTNVIAYFLLGTQPFRQECVTFWRMIDEPVAPASWEAELTNVLWMAVRTKVVTPPEALHKLDLAATLGIRTVPVQSLWHGALVRAHSASIAAYDTLFVELAEREGCPLATFDKPVLKAFPKIAQRPRSIAAS